MPLRALPPQGSASANFATWAVFPLSRKPDSAEGREIYPLPARRRTSRASETLNRANTNERSPILGGGPRTRPLACPCGLESAHFVVC